MEADGNTDGDLYSERHQRRRFTRESRLTCLLELTPSRSWALTNLRGGRHAASGSSQHQSRIVVRVLQSSFE